MWFHTITTKSACSSRLQVFMQWVWYAVAIWCCMCSGLKPPIHDACTLTQLCCIKICASKMADINRVIIFGAVVAAVVKRNHRHHNKRRRAVWMKGWKNREKFN